MKPMSAILQIVANTCEQVADDLNDPTFADESSTHTVITFPGGDREARHTTSIMMDGAFVKVSVVVKLLPETA